LKILVKNILTTIVALVLLIGSTGFQVYKHTCSTHHFSAISLIKIPVCEKDHLAIEETDNCCEPVIEETTEANCCESEAGEGVNQVSLAPQDFNCCITTIENSQLQDNLFPPVEKKSLTTEIANDLVPIIVCIKQNAERNLVLHNNDLPPPIFGKTLLCTIHQLKIDTPIC
jgi:hypothetical protein